MWADMHTFVYLCPKIHILDIHIYKYIHICMDTYIYQCMYLCMQADIYEHKCEKIHGQCTIYIIYNSYMYIHTHITCMPKYMCMYIYVYICMGIYTCMFINTYKHIHK